MKIIKTHSYHLTLSAHQAADILPFLIFLA